MTIQLIDRYLQLVDVSKHELQLIGSTGMQFEERERESAEKKASARKLNKHIIFNSDH